MKKEELLLSKLIAYSQSQAYPFHMPGHKRQIEGNFMEEFPNPYQIDITEIDGFDNLHHPEDVLKKSLEWAANVYGADKSYYLVNGSTGGILSAMSAVTRPGDSILISRNCHKAVYHGLILRQLTPSYIYPQTIEELGIQGGLRAEDVERELKRNKEIKAVLIVSPTYDGVVSDVSAIAKVAHDHGIPLIVDEAHGAHFSFGDGCFPKSALDLGADIVIQSLHKTLPSFTQTAILHVKSDLINIEKLEQYLQMYQSSSPSYLFISGIENCIFQMEENGTDMIRTFGEHLKKVYTELESLQNLKLLNEEYIGMAGIYDLDPSKIVVSCRNCRGVDGQLVTGADLSEWMRRDYQLEMEMCGADYIVAITTCFDSDEGFERLVRALEEIDKKLTLRDEDKIIDSETYTHVEKLSHKKETKEYPEICLTPAEAFEMKTIKKPLVECGGCVAGEFIYLYPPGIPLVVPGERISDDMIALVLKYQKVNLPVQGMADMSGTYLRVIAEKSHELR